MKPSQRNAIQSKLKAAKSDVTRYTSWVEKFTPGTLPHNKAKQNLAQAQSLVASLQEDLKSR